MIVWFVNLQDRGEVLLLTVKSRSSFVTERFCNRLVDQVFNWTVAVETTRKVLSRIVEVSRPRYSGLRIVRVPESSSELKVVRVPESVWYSNLTEDLLRPSSCRCTYPLQSF